LESKIRNLITWLWEVAGNKPADSWATPAQLRRILRIGVPERGLMA